MFHTRNIRRSTIDPRSHGNYSICAELDGETQAPFGVIAVAVQEF